MNTLGYLKKCSEDGSISSISASAHKLTRDILIWFCRDLLAFNAVNWERFKGFFTKVILLLHIQSPETLSNVLEDVYLAIQLSLRSKLQLVSSIGLMFNGWTDCYKAHPHMDPNLHSLLTIVCCCSNGLWTALMCFVVLIWKLMVYHNLLLISVINYSH